MRIRFLNVQNWTDEKQTPLAIHLTEREPEVILINSISRTREQGHIKIPFYNTFTVNKNNVRHAGSGIGIRIGTKFEIINNFQHDTIGAIVHSNHGPILIMTSYAPPRQPVLPNADMQFFMNHHLPGIFAGDLNCKHKNYGYNASNTKGRALYQHIYNNRINHLGPIFPTFYTRNSETTPDIVLANNRFFFNQHIQ